ncbi:MAG: peptidoglycan DD-metalloendopeptidase family protein [Bacteroidetes bacterium]|nr:peptidoglycan DD-metalloendopeptidase family protein [Bacteroidota bacterium]
MKKSIYIVFIVFSALFTANAYSFSLPDEKKPGDDKKAKTKKETPDSTKFVVNHADFNELSDIGEDNLSIDTTLADFPSHDLYDNWNTDKVHPYNFNEAFKEDSITLTLIQPEDCGFSMPHKGNYLTSLYGWRKYRPHYGTDIRLTTGDSIVSVFDGMVRYAKYCYGYGNCVVVRHRNGLETVYAHLSKILVKPGDSVEAGNLLGRGGNTGRSTGPHLHFEIRYLGQALDTQDFIDYEKGNLKSNTFTVRKTDVENKYDLRALHARHLQDLYGKDGYAGKSGYYKVRKGDTLGAIARRNGTTVKALCQKNKLKPTSVLRVGQRIRIF